MKSSNIIRHITFSSKRAFRITLIYFVISVIWILTSDKIVTYYFSDKYTIELISIIKGWIFVTCTSIIIYYLVRNALLEIQRHKVHLDLHEAQLKYIFDWASDAIFLIKNDGNIIDVNQRGIQMLDYSREELLRKNLRDFIASENNAAPLQYRELIEGSTIIAEKIINKKDGSELQVEISARMMPDDNIQVITRDITERKKYEKQLLDSEIRFSTIFKASPLGISLINLSTQIYYDVNEAFLNITGYSKEEIIGKSTSQLNIFDNPNHYTNIAKSEKESGQVFVYEISIRNKADNTRYAIAYHTIIELLNQKYFLTMVRDITDRKQFEEEIKKSSERYRLLSSHLQTVREEERSSIAREMHDELGQILTSLKMNLSLTRREIENKNQAISYQEILKDIEIMNGMIDKAVKQVRKLITQLRPELLDKLGLIAALEWFIQDFSTNTKINCRFITELDQLTIGKDKELTIFRIVQEALTNIAKHSGADRATISLEKQLDNIILEINDNGKGISDEDLIRDNSFGILGIKERAILINGLLEISGNSDKGTKIHLAVPLSK